MIAIVDYGVGNLFSLVSSFAYIGADAKLTSNPDEIRRADRIILPGVGAFADAARKLADSGLDKVVLEEAGRGKPLLGICLGMQMLFERSFEYGEHEGLGVIKGSVKPMREILPGELKIPQIGWNSLSFPNDKERSPLFKYINEGDFVYFVHSYYAVDCDDSLVAYAEYDKDITAIVAKDNVMGCQFHPEKSGEVGLNILRAFCEMETVK
jgi:glutamine amidotransferase